MPTANIRVSDLAKQVGMEPAELLPVLRDDFGHRVRTASSSIPATEARKVINRLRLKKARASRADRDRKSEARENIRRLDAQKELREAAQEKERVEAERREREEAERRAKEEAERRAREEEERLRREEEERVAARLAEEEAERRRADAAAKAAERAAAAREAEAAAAAAAREAAERTSEAVEPAAAAPAAGGGAPRGRPEPAAPPKSRPAPSRPMPAAAAPAAPAAPPPPSPRRHGTASIAAPTVAGFRPGATGQTVTIARPPVSPRPVKRPTPPRLRPSPPPLRSDRQLKLRKPGGPGKKSRRSREQKRAELGDLGEGLENVLPSVVQRATREYSTDARVELGEANTVQQLGEAMKIPGSEVLKTLLQEYGIPATINQSLDRATAEKLVLGFGGSVVEAAATNGRRAEPEEDAAVEADPDLVERAPVVTVMGHVDHGKTSLLDAIRESRVAAGEAGGITQHMSAYRVEAKGRPIVFLDTPGHEAFTRMRARGAGVTDVVILVVAADDGVKEQTLEALNHARAAKVPILVAVNKMDLPGADPDQVMRQLAERGVTPEDWGGDTVFCRVSAKTRDGLPELLQFVLDVSELEEPMANPDGAAEGVVLEARKDRGRGPVAQLLIRNGTLAVKDLVVAGSAWGKVRALLDEDGKRMKAAPPSTPVEVLGLSEVPQVGDRFFVEPDRAEARRIAEEKQSAERLEVIEGRRRLTLGNLHARMTGGLKELPVVVKGDVGGSVEAVCDALSRLGGDEVKVRVVHAAAGGITESDVDLAATTDAVVVAFGVRPEPSAERLAEREGVDIRSHTVIYHLTEEIEKALAGLLEPETEVVELGRIEVRKTFSVPRVGVIAGSYVLSGAIPRSARLRLVRDSRVVHEGRIGSLRRFKEDVAQVREGFECGVGIAGYNDVKIGDVIEAYRISPVKPPAN